MDTASGEGIYAYGKDLSRLLCMIVQSWMPTDLFNRIQALPRPGSASEAERDVGDHRLPRGSLLMCAKPIDREQFFGVLLRTDRRMAALAGGAKAIMGAVCVMFWGGLAMAMTSSIGRLVWTVA